MNSEHHRTYESAVLYLYVGFSLSSETYDEFNAENANSQLHRDIFDEKQGSIEDHDSSIGSKSVSEESTSTEVISNDTVTDELTLEILESWRLEAVGLIGDTKFDEKSAEQIKLQETRMKILKNNNQMDTNCPNKDYEFIIMVQVHNRKDFLRILLKSIKSVKDIHTALVVISIDIYDEAMNKIIREIFEIEPIVCFTIIYHPYSMAFYHSQYPAEDPNDCSRDQKTNLDKCNSKAKPDSYGHYREVQFSQIKLHWAWKLNFIRQKLAKNELSFKYVVLLEEDHFLLPDALFIAKNHILPKVEECPDNELCLGLLGIYPKTFKVIPRNDGVTKSLWISGKHNMGMIITLKWIDNLVRNADLFCNHDDYNWDFSLMKVSQGKNWRVIYSIFPRVFHMGGECGYHTKLHTCNFNAVQKSLDDQLTTRKHLYFPKNVKFTNIGGRFPVKFKGYGGWGDIRDRRLCERYFNMGHDIFS